MACMFYGTGFVGRNGAGGDRFTDSAALADAEDAAWAASHAGCRLLVLAGG